MHLFLPLTLVLISTYSQWSGGAGCSFWCNFPIEETGKPLGIRGVQLDWLNVGHACFRKECCQVRAMLQSCQSGIIPGQLCWTFGKLLPSIHSFIARFNYVLASSGWETGIWERCNYIPIGGVIIFHDRKI